jgi:Tol biopolymer transport system component
VAAFDEAQGRVLDSGRALFQHYIRDRGRPVWSVDGRRLLFWSCGERNWPCTMFIRDGDGPAREVPHDMWYVAGAVLSPDGRSVIAAGSDLKHRGGPHRIDIETGVTTNLDDPFMEYSPDGRSIRFTQVQNDELVLLERPVHGGQARELFRGFGRDVRNIRVSADGRFVGYQHRPRENAGGTITVKVAPLTGGTPRVLAELEGWTTFWQWASDNQSVFILKHRDQGPELWQLPLSGTPRKLDVDARQWSAFQISPDGKKIAFSARAGRPGFEVWAHENILPAAAK